MWKETTYDSSSTDDSLLHCGPLWSLSHCTETLCKVGCEHYGSIMPASTKFHQDCTVKWYVWSTYTLPTSKVSFHLAILARMLEKIYFIEAYIVITCNETVPSEWEKKPEACLVTYRHCTTMSKTACMCGFAVEECMQWKSSHRMKGCSAHKTSTSPASTLYFHCALPL